MSRGIKIIIGIAIGIALMVFGYFYLQSGTGTSSDSGVAVVSADDLQNQIGKDLLATLDEIRTIKLDKSFLQSAVFLSLQDFSVPIAPQPVGRDNPFAPTGVGGTNTIGGTGTTGTVKKP